VSETKKRAKAGKTGESADAAEQADEAAGTAADPTDDAGSQQPVETTEGVWPVDRLRPLVEALLFAAGDPLPVKKMVDFIEGSTADEMKATLQELAIEYLTRGIRLIEVAGGWQMRTAPEHQRYVRKLFRERPHRLTRAATETIAIVAYKQPVTRQEIETVRGVDTGGVLEHLVEKRLAKVVGRRDVPGRPLVYATTQEFLELFGLKSIRELPTLPELGHDFERMSQQGGFNEAEEGAILPLEEGDGAENETARDEAGEAREPQAGEDGNGRDDEDGNAGEGDRETDEGGDAGEAASGGEEGDERED
jgi:segregation and condensation protein B